MIDYFTYRVYKEIESEVQIININFDVNHLSVKSFQEEVIKSVIEKYPRELIVTKFSKKDMKNSFWMSSDFEKNMEEAFYFLNSLGFADPRIRGEEEYEFMMVYAGNVTGYDYLKTLNVSDGFTNPEETNLDIVCEFDEVQVPDECDTSDESWVLDELAMEGAFTDEGIYPEDFSRCHDYESYDEFEEFKKRCPVRYQKRYEGSVGIMASGEECPF